MPYTCRLSYCPTQLLRWPRGRDDEAVLSFFRGVFDYFGEHGAVRFCEDAENGGAVLLDPRLLARDWSSSSSLMEWLVWKCRGCSRGRES